MIIDRGRLPLLPLRGGERWRAEKNKTEKNCVRASGEIGNIVRCRRRAVLV